MAKGVNWVLVAPRKTLHQIRLETETRDGCDKLMMSTQPWCYLCFCLTLAQALEDKRGLRIEGERVRLDKAGNMDRAPIGRGVPCLHLPRVCAHL